MANQISREAMEQHVIESNQPISGSRHINAPELAIFQEAAHTVLEFTEEECSELRQLARLLDEVFRKAKQRLAA